MRRLMIDASDDNVIERAKQIAAALNRALPTIIKVPLALRRDPEEALDDETPRKEEVATALVLVTGDGSDRIVSRPLYEGRKAEPSREAMDAAERIAAKVADQFTPRVGVDPLAYEAKENAERAADLDKRNRAVIEGVLDAFNKAAREGDDLRLSDTLAAIDQRFTAAHAAENKAAREALGPDADPTVSLADAVRALRHENAQLTKLLAYQPAPSPPPTDEPPFFANRLGGEPAKVTPLFPQATTPPSETLVEVIALELCAMRDEDPAGTLVIMTDNRLQAMTTVLEVAKRDVRFVLGWIKANDDGEGG